MEQQNVLEQILEGSIKPTHLPLETLRKITEDFSVDRLIGEGGFGKVYKGVVGNKNVAVKRIRSSMTINEKLFRREVGNQMDVNHENVVRFLGLCSHTVETPIKNPEAQGQYIFAEIRERLLCFEFVSNGSLDKYITDELRGLEWGTRYQIIKGICAGLHYLQTKKNILHLDLKPANILLDNQMVPKITDFGLSRPIEISQTMTTHYFSPGYGAPENLSGHDTMSVKSDMYSLGAIIIELVTGQKGIPDNTNNVLRRWRHSWNKTTKKTPLEYHHQVIECTEIGKLCQNFDPHRRPSISQVMNKFVEMESTKINPIHWEDDMLGVEPLELRFGFNKEQILSCSVELSNDTDVYIAFNIETISPLPYSIEPNKDIVKPRSKFSVDIKLHFASIQDYKAALQYSSSNQRYSKELIVQSFKVNEGLTTKDINKNMFDKHTEGHHVDEIHLVVVSEEPYSEEAFLEKNNSIQPSLLLDKMSSNVVMIPLHLIKTITDDFAEKNRLGKGGYGEVYKGFLNGQEIAVKKLFPVHGLDEEAFTNEFRKLMNVQHKNIVRLIGYCYEITHQHSIHEGQFVFSKVIDRALCFEFMGQGSLSQHLSADSCIHDWPTTFKIIKGTCEAIDYLHRGRGENNYIYHLDLKPDNILMDKNMVPKIGDFGLSRLFNDSATHQTTTAKGTIGFMPPEFTSNGIVTPKNDVFSLGVIIFHLMAGEKGYNDYCDLRRRRELLEKCQQFIDGVLEYWKKMMQTAVGYTLTGTDLLGVTACLQMAMRCVDDDRDKRPSTREIINDLAKLNDEIEKMPTMVQTTTRSNMSGGPVDAAHVAGRGNLDVVIVYAFDCTNSTPAWEKVGLVFSLVEKKLANFVDSCLGYVYVMSTPNTYKSDMNFVDPSKKGESSATRAVCTKNMAAGLREAHRLMRDNGDQNGIILLFSDGLVNTGDFFDGAEDFVSTVPVHTFTLGGDAFNYGLQAIAANSPGGTFIPLHVPDKPVLSVPFTRQIDSILSGTMKDDQSNSGRWPLDVVIVYAFDCTTSNPAWHTVNDVYELVEGKLSQFVDSCLGFTYLMSTPNTCTSDMTLVGSTEKSSAWSRETCTKNMASGLTEAHKLIGYRGHSNSIILLFSDGLINKGDFFEGALDFTSKVPVHTFTLGGDEYNNVLHAMARNSPGGVFFSPLPVPNKPSQSVPFSRMLDNILNNATKDGEKHHTPNSGRWPLDVVIVYAFDCTESTPDWYKVGGVYSLVEEKLKHLGETCLGFIYVMSTPNTYVSDMNLLDPSKTGYTESPARSRTTCIKNMASGLPEAHRLMSDHGHLNGMILLFSDGQINKGDFFDGAEDFISKVPVHTFTLGGDAYNHGLQTIASNSPGGSFSTIPLTDMPSLSVPFLRQLDSLLDGTTRDDSNHPSAYSGSWPLDVVIVYAFDCTESTPAWYTVGDVYSMVQGKLLTNSESSIGFTYVMLTPNNCTSDMNLVSSIVTGYEKSAARSRTTCVKNMACGLVEAHKLISYRGHWNSLILLFSDGLINKGDFFDGAEDYISKVPVHTFTLGGDAYNHGLRSMAANSPGGKFHHTTVPDKPILSETFSQLLDNIIGDAMKTS